MEERGEPDSWVQLDAEETRKFLGLKMYYVKVHFPEKEKPTEQACEVFAWKDLQKECPQLFGYSWYKLLE